MASSIGKTVLWGGIYLLMLFSILTPLNILTLHVLMVPLVIMLVVSDRAKSLIGAAALMILPSILFGGAGFFLSLLTLFYMAPAAAMAWQYRKESGGAGSAVIAGIIAFIAAVLVVLLVSFSLRFNFSEFMTSTFKEDRIFMPTLESMLGNEGSIDKVIELLVSMIPATIIFFSVYTTIVAHWAGRKLLSRYYKPVPKLKPMKEWRLPKSIIWYYLILMLLDLFFVFKSGSTIEVVLLNAMPLLTYALALQGVGFLFYTADAKGWNRLMPIGGMILLPLMPQLIAWIGVIDMAFPLRSRMKTNG